MTEIDVLNMEYEEEDEQFSFHCPKDQAKMDIKVDVLIDDSIPTKTCECGTCHETFVINITNYFLHKAFHREGEENDSGSESEHSGDHFDGD
ncbi:hypothetical protein BASA81_005800 [Batrachochytrium salamandrivorans]|nr:hypothetical protein BASA81_005800 [Batrachochytrium salamandrivorans]